MLLIRLMHQSVASKLVFTLFILSSSIIAGNTGKIFGKVTDKQTNEPLAGVNVVIKNTGQGASTDIEGEFYLIGVPPGKYDIMISYIGYASLTVKDVLVRADLTSDLNIKIEVEAIKGAEVEVIADRLMVQKDITFTRKLVTEEDFANIPGFESSGDVFRMQAGAITSRLACPLAMQSSARMMITGTEN